MSVYLQILRACAKAYPEVLPYLSDEARKAISGYRQKQKRARQREQDVQAAISKAFEKAKEQVIQNHAYNQEELRGALQAVFRTYLTSIVHEQAQETAAGFAIGFDPAAVDRTVQTWAEKYTYELIGGLNQTTMQTVQDAVSAFTSTPDMRLSDLADLLEPAFGSARAESIAITEVTRAYAQGESVFQDMMQEDGIDMVRVWLTSEDEKVCPICGELDGQEAGPGEGFGDIDNPPAHPNCRCGVQARLA